MKTSPDEGTSSGDLATRSLFADSDLASITSFESAAKLLESRGIPAEFASDYGTGFKLLPDKSKTILVGAPFIALEWSFNDGDYGTFVSVAIVTKAGEKYILNDGSTGICEQLRVITEQRKARGNAFPQAGILCNEGLTKTSYWYNETTGETSSKAREGKEWKPASTFYLST